MDFYLDASGPRQGLPFGRYRVPQMQWMTGLEYDQVRVGEENTDSTPDIWDIYNQRSSLVDSDLVLDFNSSMDVLLVFVSTSLLLIQAFHLVFQEAGLFSAVLTAFIIETYKGLQPDQTDLTNQLLYAILRNQPASSIELSPDFSPPAYVVRVNALFFASLLTSLLTALAAMLVKQWVGYYDRGLRKITSKQIRARTRQYRYDGVLRWHMSNVVAFVPMILHLSLFLFFAGIVDFLFAINKPIAVMSIALVAAGLLLYLFATGLPLFSSGAPFRSPVTQFLDDMVQKARRYASTHRSRINSEEKAGDEAIEDPADLWFGDDEPQARIIRLTRTLDVEVVVWLMTEADKTTERFLMQMCFKKLMSFRHIAIKNPSSFFRREIPRTYRQMSTTCLDEPQTSIIPARGSRADLLCRFLDWYLKLSRSGAQTRWLRDNLPFSETAMPRAYAQYAHDNDDNGALVRAHVVYRRLFHLHLANNAACELCLKEPIFYDQFEAQAPGERQWWMQENGAFVVQDLLSITDCVLNHPTDDTSRLNRVLDQAILFIRADENAGKTFRPLRRAVRSAKPTYPLGDQWCKALNTAIGNAPAGTRGQDAEGTAAATNVLSLPPNAAPGMRHSWYRGPSYKTTRRRPSRGDGEDAIPDEIVAYPSSFVQNTVNTRTHVDPPNALSDGGDSYVVFPTPYFPPTTTMPQDSTTLPMYHTPGQNIRAAEEASRFQPPFITETDQDIVIPLPHRISRSRRTETDQPIVIPAPHRSSRPRRTEPDQDIVIPLPNRSSRPRRVITE